MCQRFTFSLSMLVVEELKILSKFLSCCSIDFNSVLKRQCSSSSSYGQRTAQHLCRTVYRCLPSVCRSIRLLVVSSHWFKDLNLLPSPELVPQSQKAPCQDAHGHVIATWFLIWLARLTEVSSAQWEALRPPGLFRHCFARPTCLSPESIKDIVL